MADKDQNQISEDYSEIIKRSIESGNFYKESVKWYLFQYIRPIIDRNNMILFFLISAATVYMLYIIIDSTFPLVEEVSVVIKERDSSLYNPIIKKLKYNTEEERNLTVDDLILEILIKNYIKNRESFDFRSANIEEINKKYTRIKNNSSFLEYKNFQQTMDKSNPKSPIRFFGKNVKKSIDFKSLDLIKKKSKGNFIKNYFSSTVPKRAEVRFASTIESIDKDNKSTKTTKKHFVDITFDYEEVDRDNKEKREIGFIVKNYKLFDVK